MARVSISLQVFWDKTLPNKIQVTIGKWINSSLHHIKFNIYGSSNERESSIGDLARDSKNSLKLALFEYLGDTSILEVELKAIWRALFFSKHNNQCNIWIETDRKAITLLIYGSKNGPWYCQGIIFTIRKEVLDVGGKVTHLVREGNSGADYLAKKGLE